MLTYTFGNYEGFKELFGVRECGNGQKSRRNKILLSYIKQTELFHKASHGDPYALMRINIQSMTRLWQVLVHDMESYTHGNLLNLDGLWLHSNKYRLDDMNGVCDDGDATAVRYVNVERDRVFKMKAGRFLKSILMECAWGQNLPEPVLLWLCEEFQQKWTTAMTGRCPQHRLVVDEDFKKIYSSRHCVGDFCSCMVDRGQHTFYRDAVKAKAAYLLNADDKIIARCVIYEEVEDVKTGERLRLAERQYSTDCDNVLKRLLVDALIKGGYIDGYKKVGVDCHNSQAFVGNDGSDWSDRRFRIKCNLEDGDTLSYQDSFKNFDGEYADNYGYGDFELDTTDDTFEGERNYDSWHEEYTSNDIITVYYHGNEYTCDEENAGDFRYIEYGSGKWEWHYYEDTVYCEDIDEYVLTDDAYYSELLDEYYYDEDSKDESEREYKADNWYYSEYDGEYFEDEDDVVTLVKADGDETTISKDSLDNDFVYEEGEDGKYYEKVEE